MKQEKCGTCRTFQKAKKTFSSSSTSSCAQVASPIRVRDRRTLLLAFWRLFSISTTCDETFFLFLTPVGFSRPLERRWIRPVCMLCSRNDTGDVHAHRHKFIGCEAIAPGRHDGKLNVNEAICYVIELKFHPILHFEAASRWTGSFSREVEKKIHS